MAVIGWGKPRVFIKDLDASAPKWEELPTPVEDSTQLTTTKGDKQEAKIEGGENEDVKYGKNTYALALNICCRDLCCCCSTGRPRCSRFLHGENDSFR